MKLGLRTPPSQFISGDQGFKSNIILVFIYTSVRLVHIICIHAVDVDKLVTDCRVRPQ